MRPRPYIGVTGFMSRREVLAVEDAHCELPLISDVLLMVGVLVSSKTLRGELNKFPARYPKPEQLGSIFTGRVDNLNLLHFNTKEQDRLLDDMCRAQDLAGPKCDGFQLNIAWPDRKVLKRYKTKTAFRRKTLVLQCGGHALDQVEHNPLKLTAKVLEYDGLIDYMLIDPSGGKGEPFDLNFAMKCIDTLNSKLFRTDIGVGIAGGLSAHNVNDLLGPILARHSSTSIDAEGRLRDGQDNLDIAKAQAYVSKSAKLYVQHRHSA